MSGEGAGLYGELLRGEGDLHGEGQEYGEVDGGVLLLQEVIDIYLNITLLSIYGLNKYNEVMIIFSEK